MKKGSMERSAGEQVLAQTVIDVDRDTAFRIFTEHLAEWWPREFTFSGESFVAARVEPRQGGEWFETDVRGETTSWGEVRAWEPPERLVLSWRISPERSLEPPEHASEVEIVFSREGESSTRIELVHRDFDRHGAGAEKMRVGMASEYGWPGLLRAYASAAENRSERH